MKMKRDNLKSALSIAIREQSKRDKANSSVKEYESCMVAGWKEILDALHGGERIEIVH